MSRPTYTYGETPEEEILRHLPPSYEMSFNREDMLAILAAMRDYDAAARPGDEEHPHDRAERLAGLRAGILDTIGIEEI